MTTPGSVPWAQQEPAGRIIKSKSTAVPMSRSEIAEAIASAVSYEARLSA